MWRPRLRFLALWLAGSLLLGTLQAIYFGYVPGALDVPGISDFNFRRIFLVQTIRYAVWPVLLPLMAAFVRAYPLGRDLGGSIGTMAWYAFSLPLWSSAHGALMVLCDYPAGLTMPTRTFYENWLNVMAGPLVQNTAVGALLLLMLATLDYQRRLRAQDRAEEELRTQAAQAQLAATLSRAQPTVFFPALQGLSALIPRDPDRAVEMVDRLGEFLRLSLQSSNRAAVELREEIDLLKRLLAVEEIRLGQSAAVEFDVAPSARECLLPGHVLVPVVAQMLRHEAALPLVLRAESLADGGGLLTLRCGARVELDFLPVDGLTLRVEHDEDGTTLFVRLSPGVRSSDEAEPEPLAPAGATLQPA
ncbi:MAG: histidine kinase [Verrucomicrobia bacterium]|nr:histidine kinase [Verrucomicrobiota bacterium]